MRQLDGSPQYCAKAISVVDDQVTTAEAAIASTGAVGMRDMGKVVTALKERYPGQMDFTRASAVVKRLLNK